MAIHVGITRLKIGLARALRQGAAADYHFIAIPELLAALLTRLLVTFKGLLGASAVHRMQDELGFPHRQPARWARTSDL